MAKIKNPVRFSTHFNVDEAQLTELGVLNLTLNVDTKLFIDPFLLPAAGTLRFLWPPAAPMKITSIPSSSC